MSKAKDEFCRELWEKEVAQDKRDELDLKKRKPTIKNLVNQMEGKKWD